MSLLCSSARLTMIPLTPSWSFDMAQAMDFAGAHGEEVVRDVLVDTQVSISPTLLLQLTSSSVFTRQHRTNACLRVARMAMCDYGHRKAWRRRRARRPWRLMTPVIARRNTERRKRRSKRRRRGTRTGLIHTDGSVRQYKNF